MNTDEKKTSACVLKMAKSHFKSHNEGILFFQIPLFPRQRSVGTLAPITPICVIKSQSQKLFSITA